ncbi:hypothetical protein OpiT1DRAFT_05437 [Opitutaceae bacterium TAV1]|nr:hypothetical protein OpiT1DRAFT_05437 [Opitutaceae bacterium TAV1]
MNTNKQISTLRTALKDANEMCRSFYTVAERAGKGTDWKALRKSLGKALNRQKTALDSAAAAIPFAESPATATANPEIREIVAHLEGDAASLELTREIVHYCGEDKNQLAARIRKLIAAYNAAAGNPQNTSET